MNNLILLKNQILYCPLDIKDGVIKNNTVTWCLSNIISNDGIQYSKIALSSLICSPVPTATCVILCNAIDRSSANPRGILAIFNGEYNGKNNVLGNYILSRIF